MSRYVRQINPRQNKSLKTTPVSEGGLGLAPRTNITSIDENIKKAKENQLAKYWYDKYEELVKEVAYQRKKDRQNINELEEKVGAINEGLLEEQPEIDTNDLLAPLDQKFVTFDQLSDHYRTMISRLQQQIETIGGGGAVDLTDLDDVDIDTSNRGHKSTLMYNEVTGKYEAADPDLNAGISNEDHSGDEIILNATDSSGTNEGGSIRQENKTATAVPSPTGDIVHTGVLQTTGDATISGTLGVGVDGTGRTDFNADVKFNGNTSGMLWDYSTNDLILYNDTRLEFGSNKDFEIWHGGTHTFMKNSGGDLRIRGDVIKINREDSSEKFIECNVNSSVDLYFNGSQKFATTTSGINVTGNVVISDGGTIGSSSDTDAITISSAGLVTLSASDSLSVSGTTTFNQDVNFPGASYNIHWDQPTSKFKFDDSAQCVFGSASGGDLKIFHQSGNSSIRNETGQFRIAGNDIRIQTQNHSEDYILCTDGGAVQIYYNDSEKLATTNTGINVIGDVGIGTMTGETVDSTVHIRAAEATLTLQRIGDENTPGIIFQSNGGNARARIYMDGTDGTNKEIVFANKVNTNMEEKFRVTLDGAKVTGNLEVTGAEVDFTALPTSDPSVAGRLWNDSGAVKVSAG